MRLPREKWPDTEGSRGILMFAQLMNEMLTGTTFEGFRVYSLDTSARVSEALDLIRDIREQRIPNAALEPVIEEIKWSLVKDPAARKLADSEISSLMGVLSTAYTLDDFQAHLALINKLTKNSYKSSLESLILDLFDDSKKRMEFRKLIGFYCSHLVNLGYERVYIRSSVESVFFDRNVIRMGRRSLDKFFKSFDGKKRRYVVQAGVTQDLGRYLVELGCKAFERSVSEPYEATLVQNENSSDLEWVFEYSVETLDPQGAMNAAFQFLNGQRAIVFLDPYGMRCEWGDKMHVTLHRARAGQLFEKSDFLENKTRQPVGGKKNPAPRILRAMTISNYAADIGNNFDRASTERIISSIRTAALARTSFNSENRLISLWSAIEVLLSDPRDVSRIVHYARLIVPCIVMRHARRQVIAVYNELLPHYRVRLRNIIKDMNTGRIGPDAFAELIFLKENELFQNRLCQCLGDNPLALHRVFKFQRDYKTVGAVNSTMDDHYNRVRWQMHRVYRARNQLVHAGRIPTYLESVILNIAEYYRSAIVTIVGRAKKEEGLSDIDQIVSEIGIKYRIARTLFKNQKHDALLTRQHMDILLNPRW